MRRTISCYPNLSVAQDLREYTGIREDILQALKYLAIVEEQIAAGSRQLVAWEGLSSAAAVAYGRCFKWSKARLALPRDFHSNAPRDVQETHEYVIAVRDKHIAHSENAYEENRLVVSIEIENGQAVAVHEVSVEPRRLVAFGDPDVPKLRRLFDWTLCAVEELLNAEAQKTLEYVRQLDPGQLAQQRMEPMPAFLAEGAHLATRPR